MIFFAMVHLLVSFAMKSFVKPRELTWIVGVLLLIITFTFGFTGYLLPWNQIAVNATKVGLQSVEDIGKYLGPLHDLPRILRETFQGEASVGQSTLGRFYALHVVLLPIAMACLLGAHLLEVQLHGMSQGVEKPAKRQEKFVPGFLLKDLVVWGVAFLALFTLAECVPFDSFLSFPLLEPYNPLSATPPGIKPEWYFYFVYYPLELTDFGVILVSGLIAMALLFGTPWIFKNTKHSVLRVLALIAAAYLVLMTLFGQCLLTR
jgi:quinol-cytochrome oxidoreductase complex cytochrome b subunit